MLIQSSRMTKLIGVLLMLSVQAVHGRKLTVINKCQEKICPGITQAAAIKKMGIPSTDKSAALQYTENGGWCMEPDESRELMLPNDWSGRIWPRTGCSGDGTCITGGCSGEFCTAGGAVPTTLVEITTVTNSDDWYDVSLVDGFNVPASLKPSAEGCIPSECEGNPNAHCPPELRTGLDSDGINWACQTACTAGFGMGQFLDQSNGIQNASINCCRGPYDEPAHCPKDCIDYYDVFKDACTKSYAFAYDEGSGSALQTCAFGNQSDYTISFCSEDQKDFKGNNGNELKYVDNIADASTCANTPLIDTWSVVEDSAQIKLAGGKAMSPNLQLNQPEFKNGWKTTIVKESKTAVYTGAKPTPVSLATLSSGSDGGATAPAAHTKPSSASSSAQGVSSTRSVAISVTSSVTATSQDKDHADPTSAQPTRTSAPPVESRSGSDSKNHGYHTQGNHDADSQDGSDRELTAAAAIIGGDVTSLTQLQSVAPTTLITANPAAASSARPAISLLTAVSNISKVSESSATSVATSATGRTKPDPAATSGTMSMDFADKALNNPGPAVTSVTSATEDTVSDDTDDTANPPDLNAAAAVVNPVTSSNAAPAQSGTSSNSPEPTITTFPATHSASTCGRGKKRSLSGASKHQSQRKRNNRLRKLH